MTTQGASTVVMVAGGLMTAYVLLAKRQEQGSTYKALWAVGVLTLGLSIVADLAPDLAVWVALMVVLGAYMRHRGQLGKVLPQAAKGG